MPYLIACLEEGEYMLATRKSFETKEQAEKYKDSVAKSREPIIINLENKLIYHL